MLYSVYRGRRDPPPAGEMAFWDERGRAWARDAYGKFHRMPDLDRQS